MNSSQNVVEGELVSPLEQNDPDMAEAWWSFRDEIEKEQNGSGTIAVFEVPLDEKGIVRGRTLRNIRLFSVAVGTLTMDDICDRILEGFMRPGERKTFKLMGHIEGQRGIKLNKFLTLAKPFESKALHDESESMRMIKLLAENADRDRREMRQMISEILGNRSQAPAVDPINFGMQMVEKLATLAAAMNRPAAGSASDPQSWSTQMMQMMTMMTTMKQFFAENAPAAPAKEGESFGDIIKSVAGVAKPLIEMAARQQAGQQRLPAPQAPPNFSPIPNATAENSSPAVPGAPPAEIPNATGDAPIIEFQKQKEAATVKLLSELKTAMPTLVDLASRGAPAKDTAELALSTMPDDAAMNDALFEFLHDPDFFKRLVLLEPGASPHGAWFEQLRVELLVQWEPDETDVAASAGGTD